MELHDFIDYFGVGAIAYFLILCLHILFSRIKYKHSDPELIKHCTWKRNYHPSS